MNKKSPPATYDQHPLVSLALPQLSVTSDSDPPSPSLYSNSKFLSDTEHPSTLMWPTGLGEERFILTDETNTRFKQQSSVAIQPHPLTAP